jgi:hypothetical protein
MNSDSSIIFDHNLKVEKNTDVELKRSVISERR